VKHEWCHGGFGGLPPDCCPVDATVISGALTVLRTSGKLARGPIPWSRIDTLEEYRTAYQLIIDAADGIDVAVWELFTFNGRGAPSPIFAAPKATDVLVRQRRFLTLNNRAAVFGAPISEIERFTQRDAVRSSFMQSTWPWDPRVSTMTAQQRRLRLSCEDYLGKWVWRRASWYSRQPTLLTRAHFERDILRLRRVVLAKFAPVI